MKRTIPKDIPPCYRSYKADLEKLARNDRDEDVINCCFKSQGGRTLQDAYECLITKLLARSTTDGGVYLNQHAKCPIVKINFIDDGNHICSVAIQKKDLYLLAFGQGQFRRFGKEVKLDMYEFYDGEASFGLRRPRGVSVAYKSTASVFNVNGDEFLKALHKIGEFQSDENGHGKSGQNLTYIVPYLEYVMWVISEAARFTRIFQGVLTAYTPWKNLEESEWKKWWKMENKRKNIDLELRHKWENLIKAVLITSQSYLDRTLGKKDDGTYVVDIGIQLIFQVENLLAVLRRIEDLKLDD